MIQKKPNTPLLQVDRCLIIPDVHQDIRWVKRILASAGEWDHCIFLGDYFDTRNSPENVATIQDTAKFIYEFAQAHPNKTSFLWGNHDLPYLEAHRSWPNMNRRALPRSNAGVPISGTEASRIFQQWPEDFTASIRLFRVINGHLLSHAGVAQQFWMNPNDLGDSLSHLEEECTDALLHFHKRNHPLLSPGIARGGEEPVGGITWQCWSEFADDLPLPQIVGHSRSLSGARQNGRSWCIDGGQTCYAVLEEDQLTVHNPE
ncbi:MAG: metallophosphoesterase [Puniceicoccales bacterium]